MVLPVSPKVNLNNPILSGGKVDSSLDLKKVLAVKICRTQTIECKDRSELDFSSRKFVPDQ